MFFYAKVCEMLGRLTGMVNSSAVLWVAQNMEDEYTYNLAL